MLQFPANLMVIGNTQNKFVFKVQKKIGAGGKLNPVSVFKNKTD